MNLTLKHVLLWIGCWAGLLFALYSYADMVKEIFW
jgi:hypothetical protein